MIAGLINPQFKVVPGFEARAAKEFVAKLRAAAENLQPSPKAVAVTNGQVAYAILDELFNLLTDDGTTFGYFISFESELTPLVEDINSKASASDFHKIVNSDYWMYEGDPKEYMTPKEVFTAFWSILGKEALMSLPLGIPGAINHVLRAIANMFDGSNAAGVEFTLRFGETDNTFFKTDGEEPIVRCTEALNNLIN